MSLISAETCRLELLSILKLPESTLRGRTCESLVEASLLLVTGTDSDSLRCHGLTNYQAALQVNCVRQLPPLVLHLFFLSLYFSVYLSLSFSLCLSISPFLCLSLSLSLCLFLPLSFCLSLHISISFKSYLYPSLPISISFSLSLSVYISLPLSLSLSFSLSFSLSLAWLVLLKVDCDVNYSESPVLSPSKILFREDPCRFSIRRLIVVKILFYLHCKIVWNGEQKSTLYTWSWYFTSLSAKCGTTNSFTRVEWQTSIIWEPGETFKNLFGSNWFNWFEIDLFLLFSQFWWLL